MSVVGIAWDPLYARGDWARAADGRLAAGDPLHSAVLVSLFSDRRAGPDDAVTDGSGDRRGWWGDAFAAQPLGSRLWLLRRAKRLPETLRRAQDYAREALAWLVADGIAARVDVAAAWASADQMRIDVTISRADGTTVALAAAWAWSA